MTHAIRLHRHGGPEVLEWQEVEVGAPGPGEVRIRHLAIGVNFIDTYHRSGLYPVALPTALGVEASGVVEAIGPEVTQVKVGDVVAYAGGPPGAYAQERVMPADRLVALPGTLDPELAAAIMLKGLTVHYLIHSTYAVGPGDTILIHAAAGGIGLIACQWAHHLGATVIGTVGSDAKAALAREHGCDHPIVYTREDFASRVREITDGRGVPVVYDSVGQATWEGSLSCLAPRGLMVTFGNASGPVPPIRPLVLSDNGSIFLTRPTLKDYTATREELLAAARALFGVVATGVLRPSVRHRADLRDAAGVHRDLEARRTTGSTVLMP